MFDSRLPADAERAVGGGDLFATQAVGGVPIGAVLVVVVIVVEGYLPCGEIDRKLWVSSECSSSTRKITRRAIEDNAAHELFGADPF